uniref:Neurotransmitter-gated ion-channel ligand-binding domain-containing protein n=1 Tax=Meloidogyne javanica TaxID=6303 RepID=A0A915MU13_MELJA
MSYNRHRRPAIYPNEAINVYLRLRLSQIIDVHELDQIMTISEWFDRKLSWKPSEYGGVSVLYVPYEMIWVPDIVLINFASWSFPTNLLHLTLVNESSTDVKVIGNYGQEEVETIVEDGIDLSDYYPSVEWDIMGTQAKRRLKRFMGSKNGDYEEIDFNLALRRKPLFYTVNLVFPCVGYSSASSSQLFANFERDFPQIGQRGIPLLRSTGQLGNTNKSPLATKLAKIYNSPKALQSFENLCFIAELLKKKDRDTKADMEWKFVAMDE